MKNAKRVILILLRITLVFITVNLYTKDKEKQEILRQEQELSNYYNLQNDAFFINSEYVTWSEYPIDNVYQPYGEIQYIPYLYTGLLIYERETGNVLTLEEIEEYLSQEFEEDGTRRLYINYEEADIQGYVEFMKDMWDKSVQQFEEWEAQLDPTIPRSEQPQPEMWEDRGLHVIYQRMAILALYLPEEFSEYRFTDLPLPVMEELLKKAYDPEYEMQLDAFLLQE